jgi:PIN domain nuclease of toxin-antitoxin system
MATIKQSVLLDSHVFVWSLEQVEKLGQQTQLLIQSGVTVYVSKVTFWELAIKYKAKKFPYDTTYLLEGLKQSGFSLLDIDLSHLQAYPKIRLPKNKDPFDTLLTAQADVERCLFVTADSKILDSSYNAYDAKQ